MDEPKLTDEEKNDLILHFKRRQIGCCIFNKKSQAIDYLFKNIFFEGCHIGFGGSMTFEKDLNLYQDLKARKEYHLIDRYDKSIQREDLNAMMTNADVFLMSSNAISMTGELVNIDGRGNRLSYLLYGPKKVVILAGTNKIEKDLRSAYLRARNVAATKNCVRLDKNTPCRKSMKCMDCLSPDCICDNILITRRSHEPFRIQVLLIEEALGY